MAAVNFALLARSDEARAAVEKLARRKNWAAREPGVIVVFIIISLIVFLLVGLHASKQYKAHKLKKENEKAMALVLPPVREAQ